MNVLKQPLEDTRGFKELKALLEKSTAAVCVSGCIESQKVNLAASILPEGFNSLTICENELKAKAVYEDWRLYDSGVLLYPLKDMVFYKAAVRGNPISRQRMKVIRALGEQKEVNIVTCTGGCIDFLLHFNVLKKHTLRLSCGEEIDVQDLAASLAKAGYERVLSVEVPGQFAVRGGIIDVFDLTNDDPHRIELWGDEIDSIRSFDCESQRSIENLDTVCIYPATEDIGEDEENFIKGLTSSFTDYFPSETVFFIDDPVRIRENARALSEEYKNAIEGRIEAGKDCADAFLRMMEPSELFARLRKRRVLVFPSVNKDEGGFFRYAAKFELTVRSVMSYNNRYDMLIKDLKSWKKARYRVVLLCASRTRGRRLAKDLMDEDLNVFFSETPDRQLAPSEIMVLHGNSARGFEYPLEKFVLITESDIFGHKKKSRHKEKRYDGKSIAGFSQLSAGDYVVHEFHGLGIYKGIEKIVRDGTSKDYIKIEYAKGDVLYVQASQISTLQKYGSSEAHSSLKLNSLSGNEWKKTKSRVKRAVKDIAVELVKLYSERQASSGYIYGPDTVWQAEFEEMFPFEETEDQINAVNEIKHDMETPGIMDRLLCGDVGYGKTEVAIRAAFKAIQENKQVVVLVPTTILAQQHYLTFMKRMKDFPVRIDMLCRFRTPAQQRKTVSDLKKGLVDIVIGTHRVLSKDVDYKDLGLLIVDEEQRFGVTHKEKIKQLKSKVDVLTLTATPIPRTLHMALIGIRDMSVLEEPPLNRQPIQTYVMEYDEEIVREAISRELARDGQVYYVFNRVSRIEAIAYRLSELLPEANIAYAHGQMKERDLESIMYRFINKEIDVLVSTTIIETGMDIANVNTMIVHDADMFGLSQLYQLRGRIGRSDRTAYAFLMYKRDKLLKEEAEKRLASIREFTELGSGIKIAMRDLEIRGAGNLLGARQSGHMADVGYDLYCKLLAEAVKEAKGLEEEEQYDTLIDINVSAYIPESYISNESQRLEMYKKIGAIESEEDKSDIIEELIDRFGEPSESVINLLEIALLKSAAHSIYITEIKQIAGELKIVFYENARVDNTGIPRLIEKYGGKLRLYAKDTPYFIYDMPDEKGKSLPPLMILKELMADLSTELKTS